MNGLYDLGARLRASLDRQAVEVAAYAPAKPPINPLAVVIDHDGDHIFITATDDTATRSGTDKAALDALTDLGATLGDHHRTLIIATPADMRTLTDLAHRYRTHPASPVIGWWDQRIDHPGTEAVHVATDTARKRWTLGVHPDRERDLATWLAWLSIESTGPQALYELAHKTTSGKVLPGLLKGTEADVKSWERWRTRITAGRPWWARDSRLDAALGLRDRSHATEWYESIRLDDPRVAVAASFTGTVIAGTVSAVTPTGISLEADQPLSRLRVGAKVTGWQGEPHDASSRVALQGLVTDAVIDARAQLTLTVAPERRAMRALTPGERITLRPERVDPWMQVTSQKLLSYGYRRGSNWIAGHGKPLPRQSNVPLDVIVAAAGD